MPALDAPITAVTVYTNRARVTRVGKIAVSPGEQTISIVNLPITVEEDSVRVSGRGAGIRILSVDVRLAYLTTLPEANLAELENQIDDLKAQDAALEDEDRTAAARLEMLAAARQQAGENFGRMIAQKRASLDEYVTFAQFASEEQERLQARRREIIQQRAALKKQLDALQAQWNQRASPRRQQEMRREIHVTLHAAEATEFEMEATYHVSGANWQPLYDVRLIENRVVLTYLATITQRSGEDWNGVSLSLSTARPAVSTTLPELRPQYVNPYVVPPPRPQARMMMAAAPRMAKGMAQADDDQAEMAAQPAPAPAAEVQQAAVEPGEGGAALTYRIAAPVTIPSDGSPQKTTVAIENLSASLDYLTVPKIAAEAYLRAKITNTSQYTLLPGQASIFHGEEFVGKTALKTTAPGEQFEAQLGVDDRVKVKRELAQREVNKRFIGGNRQTQYRYKITLTNLLPREAKITVSDQIPVSASEQIKVRLTEANPQPQEQTQMNILKWEVTLKPDEKREITFGFIVEHPAEMTVVGVE
jgi:uncharacterized protein (TIGR02231 family)